ncbi:MAG: type I pullulanase [Candidatus Epulonipiscioides saccharophilum]|nr:MAG: type I pullulanase [Epulopiscium sp. AS2M-Bin001]
MKRRNQKFSVLLSLCMLSNLFMPSTLTQAKIVWSPLLEDEVFILEDIKIPDVNEEFVEDQPEDSYMNEIYDDDIMSEQFDETFFEELDFENLLEEEIDSKFLSTNLESTPVIIPELSLKDTDKINVIISPEVNETAVTFRSTEAGFVAGSFNDWSSDATPFIKNDSTKLWEATVNIDTPGICEYKFVINGNWIQDPSNSKTLGDNSVVIINAPIEFTSPEVNGNEVTFNYYGLNATTVCVAGSFNDWNATDTPMTKSANGLWQLTKTLEDGEYQYKFVVDENYINDPFNINKSGDNNIFLIGDPIVISPEVNGEKVTFRYYSETATSVTVSGSFNGWVGNKNYLADENEDNIWEATLDITPGQYEYKFVVDESEWIADPSNKETSADGNSILNVLSEVKVVSPEIVDNKVTFRHFAPNAETVSVAGTINGWNAEANPMAKDETGVWSITLECGAGVHQYKFVENGSDWKVDPNNTAEQVDGNSVFSIFGLAIEGNPENLAIDKETKLSSKAKLYTAENTTGLDVTVEYEMAESVSTVKLTKKADGTYIHVLPAHVGNVNIQAKANDYVQDLTFKTVTSMNEYTINYYRHEDYTDWNLWLWDVGGAGKGVEFTTEKKFTLSDGLEYTFKQVTHESTADKIGIIPRLGEWIKQDGADRFIEMPADLNAKEVWLVEGHTDIIYTDPSVINFEAKVKKGYVDSNTEVTVTLSEAGEITNPYIIDVAADNKKIEVTATKIDDKKYIFTLPDGEIFESNKLYKVGSDELEPTEIEMRKMLDYIYYSGDDLGLTYSDSASTFKVWAPTAQSVSLMLYDDAGEYNENGLVLDHSTGTELAMDYDSSTGTWAKTESGDLNNKYYMYKLTFANGKTNYAVDPYARSVSANGQRTAIIDLSLTNDAFLSDEKPPIVDASDAVIYELHIRDFSIDPSANFANPGDFNAFTEVGLTTANGNSIGIDHLKELGVTHVHLLPSYDYGSVNEMSTEAQFNWGYDPQNYNVPEGSYSSDPTNPYARVEEYKNMVNALHEAGIRVVMDVVYNHTFSVVDGPFDKVVPNYYYRTFDDGTYSNGAGCGNEVASERPMVRKYITDSVMYWAEEYHLDGFRFDLMGLIDIQTMSELTDKLRSEVDPDMLIYGEPWQAGGSILPGDQQTLKGMQRGEDFKVFNDNIRGAIKGDSDSVGKGFATGELGKEGDIIEGAKGAINTIASKPTEIISYVTAHDNLNLWDKVIATQELESELGFGEMKDGSLVDGGSVEDMVNAADPHKFVDENDVFANETVKRSILANGIALTSQGIPFIHAGEEFLRSKYGDHNSYKSPDAINMIRWDLKDQFSEVTDYYAGLIELRNTHPAFSMETAEEVNKHFTVFKSDENVVGFNLGEYANGDSYKNISVIYNGNDSEMTVELPHAANWNIVVNETTAGTEVIKSLTNSSSVTVAPLSMMVLYEDERIYDKVPSILEISEDFVGLGIGDSHVFDVIIKDQHGVQIPMAANIESSDPDLVSISGQKITANQVGKTTLTFTAKVPTAKGLQGISAQVEIEVVDKLNPKSITIKSEEPFVYAGFTLPVSAEIKDQFDQVMTAQQITWSSNNTDVATIGIDGTITGLAEGSFTITADVGNISATLDLEVKKYEKRFIVFEYYRPAGDYDGWNLWVWNTGVKNDQIDFTADLDGKKLAFIEIGPTTESIGFIIRKGDWEEKDTDGDRSIFIPKDQTITKVQIEQGEVEFNTLKKSELFVDTSTQYPSVTYRYRNDALFKEGLMDSIELAEIEINGEKFPMTYDPEQEWLEYTMSDLAEGEYLYSFHITVDGQTIEYLDPYNYVSKDGKSLFVYEKLDISSSALAYPSSINYNENSVVTIEIDATPEDISKLSKVIIDTTELGGDQINVPLDLLSASISVKDYVEPGRKTLPIVIYDNVNNAYTSEVEIEIVDYKGTDIGFDEAVIYFMLTDRFYNGDKSNDDPYNIGYDPKDPGTYHGGDFVGITEKLNYLESLGVNTIWISPIVENVAYDVRHDTTPYQNGYYAYHGYWAENFEELNPHFGTIEQLHELIDSAHEKGIKIMVDVVLNHSGYGLDNPSPNPPANYPTDEDRARFEGMLRKELSSDEVLGQLAGLPDFRTEDPEVRDQLVKWQVAWVETLGKTAKGNSIDYFRIDTVKHVEDATWIHLKNELTKVDPEFKVIGEVYGAHLANDSGYLDSGMMDSILDFEFKNIAGKFANGEIESAQNSLVAKNDQLDNTNTVGNFLSSHDEGGFLKNHLGGDVNKLKAAVSLQATVKGQPVIYYGEEMAYSGDNDYPVHTNRPTIDWNKETEQKELIEHYQKVFGAREKYSKVFAKGTHNIIGGNDALGYSIFEREYDDEAVIVAINLGEAQKTVITTDFKDGAIDLYSGTKYKVDNGKIAITLPAIENGGTLILVNDDSDDDDDDDNKPPTGGDDDDDDDDKPPTGGGDDDDDDKPPTGGGDDDDDDKPPTSNDDEDEDDDHGYSGSWWGGSSSSSSSNSSNSSSSSSDKIITVSQTETIVVKPNSKVEINIDPKVQTTAQGQTYIDVALNASSLNQAIDLAVKEKTNVTIHVDTKQNIDTAYLSIKSDTLKNALANTDLSLEIVTDVGGCSINYASLSKMLPMTNSEDLKFEFKAQDSNNIFLHTDNLLNGTTALINSTIAVNINKLNFSMVIKSGTKELSNVPVEMIIPYKATATENTKILSMYQVFDTNQVVKMNSTYDAVNQQIHFTGSTSNDYILGMDIKLGNPFLDLTNNSMYFSEILTAVNKGYMSGISATMFEPNIASDRKTLAEVIRNIDIIYNLDFIKVFQLAYGGDWYSRVANWVATLGMTHGYNDPSFGPELEVTRENLAIVLYNYNLITQHPDYLNVDKPNWFTSFNVNSKEAMTWATTNKLIEGVGAGLVTRGELAAIITRFINFLF